MSCILSNRRYIVGPGVKKVFGECYLEELIDEVDGDQVLIDHLLLSDQTGVKEELAKKGYEKSQGGEFEVYIKANTD